MLIRSIVDKYDYLRSKWYNRGVGVSIKFVINFVKFGDPNLKKKKSG